MCHLCWKNKPRDYEFKKAKVGDYGTHCPTCAQPAIIMRFGTVDHQSESCRVTCKCFACKATIKADLFCLCEDCADAKRQSFMYLTRFAQIEETLSYSTKCATCGIEDHFEVEDLCYQKPRPKLTRKQLTPKRPVTRTFGGLRGEKHGPEWWFEYNTGFPYILKARKEYGEWGVFFGEVRIGSGRKLADAVKKAKRQMTIKGYQLV